MVNDDKPFLRLTPTGVLAYGSPWSGKHGLATNICVPLQGICLLHRGAENRIQPISAQGIRGELRHQLHAPADQNLTQKGFAILDRLLAQIPTWEMYCNKDASAALVAYEVMSRTDA